jgi:general secretion pathway protein F
LNFTMPRFNYIALGVNGKTAKGTVNAESPYAARKQLRSRGMHPTTIKEVSLEGETKGRLLSMIGTSKRGNVIEFTRQMAILLNSEIKLTESLSVLMEQTSDARFKNIIMDIRDRVVNGESFADALSDYGEYFDIIYLSMVRVGETTGSLGVSLGTIAAFMEKRQKVESKIKTVMIYPMCVLFIGIVAVIILTTGVLPKIIKQFEKTGQELPWITKAMMTVSYVLIHWWPAILIIAVALVWGLRRFIKTEKGAYLRDRMMLSVPIFGPLFKQRVVSRFASTLSTLLNSGLSMAASLRVVSEVTGNTIMSSAVRKAKDRILSGADIATPLRESGVIDPAIAHMVAVGEKSGELPKMLKSISDNLESSSDMVIERLSAAIEPVIIIIMAVVVGLIALASLLPIIRFSAGQF